MIQLPGPRIAVCLWFEPSEKATSSLSPQGRALNTESWCPEMQPEWREAKEGGSLDGCQGSCFGPVPMKPVWRLAHFCAGSVESDILVKKKKSLNKTPASLRSLHYSRPHNRRQNFLQKKKEKSRSGLFCLVAHGVLGRLQKQLTATSLGGLH
jgi:hypothetical protein